MQLRPRPPPRNAIRKRRQHRNQQRVFIACLLPERVHDAAYLADQLRRAPFPLRLHQHQQIASRTLIAAGRQPFATPDGRARLWCVEPEPIADAPDADYPFLLNTGRTVEHWHTRTKTGRVPILERLSPEGWVEMNPADAGRMGLCSGDRVVLTSRRGAVEGLPVRVTGIVRPGEVFVPFHWDELCVNRLTVDEFDPVSREPNYKQSAVAITKV